MTPPPVKALRLFAAAALLGAALFSALPQAAPSHAASVEVLAVVDGTPITNLDFEERRNFLIMTTGIKDNAETAPQIDKDVMQMLVDDVIKRSEGLKLGGGLLTAARQRAAEIVDLSFSQHGEDPNIVMERLGIDRAFAEEKFLTDVLWASSVQSRFAEEFSNVQVEAVQELSRIKENARKPQVNIDEIVLVPEPTRNMPQTLLLARQMVDAIRGGADFGRIAQQFSISGTGRLGGKVGWVVLERLPDKMREAIDDLPSGTVADPVEIDGAAVIYRVNGVRVDGGIDPLETRVRIGRLVLPFQDNDSSSREEAAAKVSTETASVANCSELKRIHEGYGSGRDFEFGEVKMRDLAPRLRDLLLPLEINEATEAINFSEGIAVFMVCDKLVPELALPQLADIENSIRNRHFSVLSSRYLAQLRRGAIIDYKGTQ